MSIPKNLRTLKTNFEKADGLGIKWQTQLQTQAQTQIQAQTQTKVQTQT